MTRFMRRSSGEDGRWLIGEEPGRRAHVVYTEGAALGFSRASGRQVV